MEADPVNSFITRLDASGGVPNWWEPLFQASSDASIFLSAAWLQSWLEVYGRFVDGYWIQWKQGDVTVGGCLLACRTAFRGPIPLRMISVNGGNNAPVRTPSIEYNDILHVEGFEEAIAADFARVISGFRWDQLQIDGHSERALLEHFISRAPELTAERQLKPARYIDLRTSPGTAFENTLTGKVGREFRRRRRLHENKFGKILVKSAASLEEAMLYFSELCRLSNMRWQQKNQVGSFMVPAVVDFHKRLIPRLWALDCVELIRIGNESVITGYLYNFICRKKVHQFQNGFVYEQDSNLSPGMLTHALAIEHYRTRGFHEYDLLAGDSEYKRALANSERKLYWTVVYNKTRYVRLLMYMRYVKSRLMTRRGGVLKTTSDR